MAIEKLNGRYKATLDLHEEGETLRKRMVDIVNESKTMMADSVLDMESEEFSLMQKSYHLVGDCLRYMEAFEDRIISIENKIDRILEKLEEK